jgi:hypothetical protein
MPRDAQPGRLRRCAPLALTRLLVCDGGAVCLSVLQATWPRSWRSRSTWPRASCSLNRRLGEASLRCAPPSPSNHKAQAVCLTTLSGLLRICHLHREDIHFSDDTRDRKALAGAHSAFTCRCPGCLSLPVLLHPQRRGPPSYFFLVAGHSADAGLLFVIGGEGAADGGRRGCIALSIYERARRQRSWPGRSVRVPAAEEALPCLCRQTLEIPAIRKEGGYPWTDRPRKRPAGCPAAKPGGSAQAAERRLGRRCGQSFLRG